MLIIGLSLFGTNLFTFLYFSRCLYIKPGPKLTGKQCIVARVEEPINLYKTSIIVLGQVIVSPTLNKIQMPMEIHKQLNQIS